MSPFWGWWCTFKETGGNRERSVGPNSALHLWQVQKQEKRRGGLGFAAALSGEKCLCLWGLSSPLWSPDEPCTAVWSKEVIALWRKPQRPTRTIRIMCFWVTGAQFQVWEYYSTSQQWQWWGNGLTLAFVWCVIQYLCDGNVMLLCLNWFTLATIP